MNKYLNIAGMTVKIVMDKVLENSPENNWKADLLRHCNENKDEDISLKKT